MIGWNERSVNVCVSCQREGVRFKFKPFVYALYANRVSFRGRPTLRKSLHSQHTLVFVAKRGTITDVMLFESQVCLLLGQVCVPILCQICWVFGQFGSTLGQVCLILCHHQFRLLLQVLVGNSMLLDIVL